jgi:two-component system sensor histidine kinase YesM
MEEMINVSDSLSELLEHNGGVTDSKQTEPFILRSDINTIAAFDSNGNLLLKTNNRPIKKSLNITQQDWFRSVPPGSQNSYISAPHVQSLYQGEFPWVMSLSKGISWMQDGKRRFGIILVDLNFKNIKELCSNELGQNGYIYILGGNTDLIYHPKQQMIYYGVNDKILPHTYDLPEGNTIINVDNVNISVSVKHLRNTNWRVVGVSQLNGLFSYDSEITGFITLIICTAALLIIFLSIIVSVLATHPIRNLIKLMGRVEEGEMNTFANANFVFEVQELSRSFNNMVYRIKYLMAEILEEQRQLRKSEMKTLYAQINPHFLYNTLDSIVWMAESGENKNAVKMIAALAQFFRLSLNGGKDTVTVEEELKHAENYLIIQKMRYDDQFSYEITADSDVLQCQTLKIVLQPIVENSIIHGVGNLPYPGKITVRAKRSDDMLLLQVIDNGFGIEPDKLARILEIDPTSKSGIGVKNVNSRIQLQYGAQYGLYYESEPDEGTTVTIRLPFVK